MCLHGRGRGRNLILAGETSLRVTRSAALCKVQGRRCRPLRAGLGGRRGSRVHRHALHQATQAFTFNLGLLALVRRLVLFDLAQELTTFRTSVINKRLDVLLKAVNCLLHLGIPSLGTLKTRFEVEELLVCPLVLVYDRSPLALYRLILALLCSHAFVLEETVEGRCQLLHQRCLLMVCLKKSALVWPELLQLCLE